MLNMSCVIRAMVVTAGLIPPGWKERANWVDENALNCVISVRS